MVIVQPYLSLYNCVAGCTSLAVLGDQIGSQSRLTLLSDLFQPDTQLLIRDATFSAPRFYVCGRGATLFVGITGVENVKQASLVLIGSGGIATVGLARVNVLFAAAAQAILDTILSTFNSPWKDAFIVGHSFGGAVAEVLAFLGRSLGVWRNAHVASFGAPRPGDFTFAAAMRDIPLLRWMNVEDPIPRFPALPNEAPAAYQAGPPFATMIWSTYVQPAGGVLLYQQGGILAGELPPQTLPITDVRLLVWATGYKGFGNTAHTLSAYLTRIITAPSPQFNQTLSSVNRLLLTTSGEGPVPPDSSDALSELRTVAQDLSGVSTMSVVIPLANRPSLVKVTSKIYRVQWGSQLITTGMTRTNAKAFRKSLFKALRVLQTQKNVDPAAFGSALATYLNAATNPSGGFVPVLSLM